MTIAEIYTRFSVPPHLQRHMFLVQAIALFIADHWKGESIDKKKLRVIGLLHDIGNTIKFDLVNHPEFLEDEKESVEFWKEKQKELWNKYGVDDHEGTKKMLEEIHISPDVVKTIMLKSFGNAIETEKSTNWLLKILLYSDLRVAPSGILPLKDRLDEVITRRPVYRERTDLYDAALTIEKEIQEQVTMPLSSITSETIHYDSEELLALHV